METLNRFIQLLQQFVNDNIATLPHFEPFPIVAPLSTVLCLEKRGKVSVTAYLFVSLSLGLYICTCL